MANTDKVKEDWKWFLMVEEKRRGIQFWLLWWFKKIDLVVEPQEKFLKSWAATVAEEDVVGDEDFSLALMQLFFGVENVDYVVSQLRKL